MCGSRSRIIRIPYNKAFNEGFEDMRHREPDISKIKAFTGFKPEIGIGEMIKSMINSEEV